MEVTLHKVKIGRGGDVEQRIRERRKRGIGRGIGEEIRRVSGSCKEQNKTIREREEREEEKEEVEGGGRRWRRTSERWRMRSKKVEFKI